MPEPESFHDFAARHVGELMRLARYLTLGVNRGERLVELALVHVWRSWPDAQTDSDGLRMAQRALVGEYLGRQPLVRFDMRRGEIELQDRRRLADDAAGAVEAGGPGALAQAVDELSPRHRTVLALRVGQGLSVPEAARVLGWPQVAVREVERRALNEVRLAADLPAASISGADDPSETGLRAGVGTALRARGDGALDEAALLQRVAQQTGGVRRPPPRRRLVAGAVAVGAVAVVTAGIAGRLAHDSTPGVDVSSRPPAPAGTRLVGYRGIAVAVPADWRLRGSSCGRVVVHGTTYHRPTGDAGPCASVGATSVTLGDAPPNSPPLFVSPGRTSRVAGHVAQRTGLSRVEGVYQQTVFVFGADFMMTVRSADKTTVATVVSSMQAVPAGYTVVPNCERLPVRAAVAALEQARLTSRIAHTSSLSPRFGTPPVTFQNRISGDVVREGTPVALTIPSF